MTRSFRGLRKLSSTAVTSVVIVMATIGLARAQDICANIDQLIDQSHTQFAGLTEDPNGETGEYDASLALAGASYCRVTQRSKGSFYHCGWEFPYRAKQAYDAYDEFVQQVNGCIGQHATVHADQSVNHPDFYELRRYELEQATVSVSVKDKGALGSTFVFIRVQGAPQ